MTWFKVDDGFWSHPKTATLSDAAVTLWVRAGSYCCQHLTDGFVKHGALRLLGDTAAVGELVDVVLWHEVDGGWEFHDWDEYQETSEVVKKRRDDARERQRRYRELQEEKRRQSQQSSQGESRVTDDVTDEVTDVVTSQPPTRPDPTRPDQSVSTDVDTDLTTAPKGARGGGTRIKPDWIPSQKTIDQIRAEYPNLTSEDLKKINVEFIDYWVGVPGQKGRKADWDATWRNRVREVADRRPRASLKVVNGGSTVDDKVNGWFEMANTNFTTGRELE